MNPEKALGLDVSLALGGSIGHLDQHEWPQMQQGPWKPTWLELATKPQSSAWPTMTTGALGINSDPGYGCGPGPYIIMAQVYSPGHPNWPGQPL